MATATSLLTVADYERETAGRREKYELRHGELVPMTFPKPKHGRIQHRLFKLLNEILGLEFRVTFEQAFRPLTEHELWAADLAVTRNSRLEVAEASDQYLSGSPEIVIEVLSPSNTADEIDDRRDTCFAGGCLEFWVVNPKRRTVQIFTPDGKATIYIAPQPVPVALTGQELSSAAIFE